MGSDSAVLTAALWNGAHTHAKNTLDTIAILEIKAYKENVAAINGGKLCSDIYKIAAYVCETVH